MISRFHHPFIKAFVRGCGIVVGIAASAALASNRPPVPTFEDGKEPTSEIHVKVDGGSDSTGNGTSGNPYASIARGLRDVGPGAAVRIHPGTYKVRVNLTDLAGTAAEPIWIGGVPGQAKPVIEGESEGVHLTRTRYLILHDLEVRNTTQNGINCDDGGRYSDPDATRYMIFRDLHVHDIGGSGNQDGIKLSGVDDYWVINCRIDSIGGGISGSGIDHVGCHDGLLAYNKISRTSGSGIQCKGGSRDLEILGNLITDFGQRSVNIGGSTGFQFFRPPLSETEANAEARNIRLTANVIKGGVASLAFVGCVDCEVVNNTFIAPENWLVRILQESTSTPPYTFQECANNTITNNIFYFDRGALANSTVNIGGNTNAASFNWANNLWFAFNNPAQSAPNPNPVQDGAVIGLDPAFSNPGNDDYRIQAGSPASGAGLDGVSPKTDFAGTPYKSPPSIGAHEISAWQAWRARHFPLPAQLNDPAISGPHAVPGGDGIPNHAKFAFDLIPHQEASTSLPLATMTDDRLQFRYRRPLDAACHVDVIIEVSDDLNTWLSGPAHTVTLPPLELGNGSELVTVEDRASATAKATRFMRAAVQFIDGG